jgi:uncharacterized protein YggT (Ycf19 family)
MLGIIGIMRLIVTVVFYIIEALLLFRFVLVFFAANLTGTFARWIMTNSAALVAPFKNIFPTMHVGAFTVDFTVLLALLVYLIVGQLIMRVLYYFEFPRDREL